MFAPLIFQTIFQCASLTVELLACTPSSRPAPDQQDEHSYDPGWGAGDSDYWVGHGTRMSGIALYGDLQPVSLGNQEIVLNHRLETVKILPTGCK